MAQVRTLWASIAFLVFCEIWVDFFDFFCWAWKESILVFCWPHKRHTERMSTVLKEKAIQKDRHEFRQSKNQKRNDSRREGTTRIRTVVSRVRVLRANRCTIAPIDVNGRRSGTSYSLYANPSICVFCIFFSIRLPLTRFHRT